MTDPPKSSLLVGSDAHARGVLPADLVDAFVRLAKGDFTVRLPRNLRRDTDDALAFFVNVVAEQLQRLTADRERAHADQLAAAQAQLQLADRLATMGTVVAGVAHEINNPLAFVMSNLQFVEEELAVAHHGAIVSPERRDELMRALASARGGARRIKQIVGELRSFTRSEPAPSSAVDLNKAVEVALALIQHEMRHHARIVRELGVVPAVLADEGRLVQVLVNLLQNAAQAIPTGDVERHVVRIVTGTDDAGDAFVEVHDSGCGIAPEERAHLFDLFFTTKAAGVGTGLGLSICRRIVEGLGGRIEVESTVGVGSSFRVVIPAAAPVSRSARPAPSLSNDEERPRLRILVIDDEREIVESIQRLLRGHDVEAAISPLHALGLVGDRPYDVILCDVLMPEMNGMELHAEIAKVHPDVARRIVFMTGGTSGHTVGDFFSRVENERIDKPFDVDELWPFLERARRR